MKAIVKKISMNTDRLSKLKEKLTPWYEPIINKINDVVRDESGQDRLIKEKE